MDTYKRTLSKTISYRLTTFVLTFVITFLISGESNTSTAFAVMSLTLGALTFMLHERIWVFVQWGRDGFDDKKIRSVAKTITYRLWSVFIVFVIGVLFGFQTSQALTLSVALNIMYLLTHYLNERVWNRVEWGKS